MGFFFELAGKRDGESREMVIYRGSIIIDGWMDWKGMEMMVMGCLGRLLGFFLLDGAKDC